MKLCNGCKQEFSPLSINKYYCHECSRNKNYLPRTVDARERYSRVQRSAAGRGISFDLHYEEFSSYYGLPCAYCGDKTETVNLDRVDSNKGYSIENVAPCCQECNTMKGTKSLEYFISKIKAISRNF